MRQFIAEFLCRLFCHKWRLCKDNHDNTGTYKCARCHRYTVQIISPRHPNCRCIITPDDNGPGPC